MNQEDSLKKKGCDESRLELVEPLIYLGQGRTLFKTDPFGYGKGTDTENARYFARGKGELKLDNFHSEPTIVHPQDYNQEFRESLEPYVQGLMDLAIPLVGKSEKWLWEIKEQIDNALWNIVFRKQKQL